MNKILKSLIIIIYLLLPSLALAADGDISSPIIKGSIPGDGWVLQTTLAGFKVGGTYTMGLGTNNNPSTAKVVLTVTSPQVVPADDSVTTVTRTIYGTKFLRKPYPNQTEANETDNTTSITTEVALSDFLYTDDTATVTISGDGSTTGFYQDTGSGGGNGYNNSLTSAAVTNSSTLDYSETKPIFRWAWTPYELTSASTYRIEGVAFNRFAKNGKPVQAVKYTCTDEHSNSVTSTITDMTISSRNVDGMPKVLTYAYDVPTSSFTSGDVITCNAKVYPWVGDMASVLSTDTGYDDERLSPFKFLYSSNYGGAFAYVNTATGNDGTGAVYNTQALAEAGSAYATIQAAQTAIKTYNNSNYSRNEPGGGVVLLAAGTHEYPGASGSDLGVQETWLTIKPATGVPRVDAIISGNTSSRKNRSRMVKFEGLNITSSTGLQIFGTTTTDILWLDNNIINFSASPGVEAFRIAYATNNSITAWSIGFGPYTTVKCPYGLIRGNYSATNKIMGSQHSVLGNYNIYPIFDNTGNTYSHQTSDDSVFAFNVIKSTITGLTQGLTTEITKGIAIAQNLVENISNTTQLIAIGGGGSFTATVGSNNVIIHNNTFVGQRENFAYNAYLNGDTYVLHKNWSQRNNFYTNLNCKDDTFSPIPEKTISGITKANPGIVTATAHGLTNGNKVYIYGVTDGNWTTLNGNTYSICNKDTNTFQLSTDGCSTTIDTSGYAASCSSGCGTETSANPAKIGGWAVNYGVASSDQYIKGSMFLGELYFLGINSIYNGTDAFVNDLGGNTSGGTGGGDYHLYSNSNMTNMVSNGNSTMPFDLDGKRRRPEADDAGCYTRGLKVY